MNIFMFATQWARPPSDGRLSLTPYIDDYAICFTQIRPLLINRSCACHGIVPEEVGHFTIGGHQAMKRRLGCREHGLLGRARTTDEAREITHLGRRLATVILLQPELDVNYQRVKAASHDWKPRAIPSCPSVSPYSRGIPCSNG